MLRHIARHSIRQATRQASVLTRRACIPIVRHKPALYTAPLLRSFNTSFTTFNTHDDKLTYSITELSTDRYHRLSDEILEHIVSVLEEINDEIDMKGFDIEYNQGVMTISLGDKGTYVINKQPPNHQIWLSSPISGPQRYDYDEKHQKWFYHRDNHTLDEILNTELSKALGKDINVLEAFEPEEK
ncbi:MAG: hypothetical protein EXX96DRAFT_558993 [Benjaminiella poitrasii]|nr:MAG: hypothetical protein EXX96DRAFT_558993 [Benjaminiella poitrasii]